MPTGVRSWKQKSKIKMEGKVAVKVTTRHLRMKDGTDKELTMEETKQIDI